MKQPFRAVDTDQRRAWVAAVLTALVIALCLALFGSADVEESANSSYSIAAHHQALGSDEYHDGRHEVFGVPVFDTLQGTGDRLPYQASWAQSVTWWLRWFVDWNGYSLVRAFLFAIPGLWLCMTTLQSWVPKIRYPSLILFGLLASSSFGLNLRHNEWSDHYVQVIGVCGVALFLVHRRFHDERYIDAAGARDPTILCLAVSINGVVTGHPGFWPVAVAVMVAIIGSFLTSEVCQAQTRVWVRSNRLSIGVVAVATLFTFIAVLRDLLSERAGQPFGTGRLARTQGLFSEYAFGGLYGLSDGGSLPHVAKQVVASLLGTTLMPFFVLFDSVLPQYIRASDFQELPRVEFTGSLIVLAILLGWRALENSPVRPLVLRMFAAQVIICVFVAGSAADALPATLAASGAWMTLEVVLVLNVFVGWILVRNVPSVVKAPRIVARVNLGLVGVWCLVQFGFLSIGSGLQLPKTYPSWFSSADALVGTNWFVEQHVGSSRSILVQTPSLYDFLPFVALGQPIVATADPKIRSSGQLQSSYAFNYSINPPTFADIEADHVERVLDFLQVRTVLVGLPSVEGQVFEDNRPEIIDRLGDSLTPRGHLDMPGRQFEVFERSKYSALIVAKESIADIEVCPILQRTCALVADGSLILPSSSPRLSLCADECLWLFASPAIPSDKALVLPVTYDNTLVVRKIDGRPLTTADAGGFLAVFNADGIPQTTLSITLDPDGRMLARVVASYVNLAMAIFLVCWAVYPRWVPRRHSMLWEKQSD
ncbi:MAG: hypothetical protein ACO31D_04430 [Ilumatobacteraceae bacterium]